MKWVFRSSLMAVVAMLAMGAGAGSASAHEWLLGGSPVTEATSVKTSPKLTLILTENGNEGEAEISCNMSEKYAVNKEGKGSITELGLTSCKLSKASQFCESQLKSVKAMHLPWSTQITERFGEVVPLWNELSGSGLGRPGFQFECRFLGINIPYKCEGSYGGGLEKEGTLGVREFFVKKIGTELPGQCGNAGENFLWIRGENNLTGEGGKVLSFR